MIADQGRFRRSFLLLLALFVSALFLYMIRGFLMPLLLAAIFSGLAQPLYRWLLARLRGRGALAATATLLILLAAVGLPLTAFLGLVASNAIDIAGVAAPWIQENIARPSALEGQLLERFPILSSLEPYRGQVVSALGRAAESAGTHLFNSLSALTGGTVGFLLDFFVLLYAMFFFLIGGSGALERILSVLPLPLQDKHRLVDRFTSVARATLRGTLIIGVIQGSLAGLALWAAGIEGVAFWSTLMMILAIIPGIGTALVWMPAVGYLFIVGRGGAALAVAVWCAVVVGSIDNLLRPRLVGGDTKLPDLMILLGTLGGLSLFGAAGLLVGPIIAALFVTIWEIYGATFRALLDEKPAEPPPAPAST